MNNRQELDAITSKIADAPSHLIHFNSIRVRRHKGTKFQQMILFLISRLVPVR